MVVIFLIIGILAIWGMMLNFEITGSYSGCYRQPYVRPSDGKVFGWKYSECGETTHCRYKLKMLVLNKLGFKTHSSIPTHLPYPFRQLCSDLDTLMKDLELDDCLSYPGNFKSDQVINDAKTNANADSFGEQIRKECNTVDEVIVSLHLSECYPGVYDTRSIPKKIYTRGHKGRLL